MPPENINLQVAKPLRKGEFTLDREAGVIAGVSLLSVGPALGHGFEVDDKMLKQVRDQIKARGSVRSRLGHPSFLGGDAITTRLGRIDNPRIDGGQLRGDFKFGSYADKTPGGGNAREWLMDLVEEDAGELGLSIVFSPDEFEDREGMPPLGRSRDVTAVDWVDEPAANPTGLLSSGNKAAGEPTMPEELRNYLVSLGLDAEATDEQALAYMGKLKGKQLKAAQLLADEGDDDDDSVAFENENDDDATGLSAGEALRMAGDAATKALAAERQRVKDIRNLSKQYNLGESFAEQHIENGTELAKVESAALKALAEQNKPLNVTGGEDLNLSTAPAAMADAIMLRAGAVRFRDDHPDEACRKPHERAHKFRGLSMGDMVKHWLHSLGVRDAFMLSNARAVDLLSPGRLRREYPQAFALAQSTGDFGNILQDATNKTLRAAYLDAPNTWSIWARRATAPDFKTINRPALSEVPDLTERKEGGEIKYVTVSDSKESYQLTEYAGGVTITRRAIINDDLSAFNRIVPAQGAAARRKEDDLAYGVITDNAAMADGGNLFNATAVTTDGGHANLTSSGTALSVASLNVGFSSMFKQKGPKNAAYLELVPSFLLVASDIKATADQLINSTVDPAKNNSTTNPFANRLQVIPSARLNANDNNAWYLFADYRSGQVDTIEVCFLEDEPMPVLKQETDFDTDDMKMAVRHTVAAAALDWRGVYKNNGA